MRYLLLATLSSMFFCGNASAKLFFTQHQELYRKNTLKHITEINTNKNKLVDTARELKKKFTHKKDQHLLNYYIKHQKPQTKLFINKDWIDIKVNGRQMAKVTGINGDTNTLFINDKLIDFSEPLLVKNIELIKKALTKRKRNVWTPMDLFIPRAEAMPVAMLALAIYLSTQKMATAAKKSLQSSDTPSEICPSQGGETKNYIRGRQSRFGDTFGEDIDHFSAFDLLYFDKEITEKGHCRAAMARYVKEYRQEWEIEGDNQLKIQDLCVFALGLRLICNGEPKETPTEDVPGATPPTAPSAPTTPVPVSPAAVD